MSTLFRKQLMGGASAAAALAVVVLTWLSLPQFRSQIPVPADEMAARLAFAVQWLLVPGWMLLAGVFGASRRGFYADAIEGTRTPATHTLEINLRYNQNTIEQTILAAVAWTSLAVVLPHDDLILIPAMAVLFAVSRITFWIGYALHPMGRTFGMSLTVIPTIFAFAALTWIALT